MHERERRQQRIFMNLKNRMWDANLYSTFSISVIVSCVFCRLFKPQSLTGQWFSRLSRLIGQTTKPSKSVKPSCKMNTKYKNALDKVYYLPTNHWKLDWNVSFAGDEDLQIVTLVRHFPNKIKTRNGTRHCLHAFWTYKLISNVSSVPCLFVFYMYHGILWTTLKYLIPWYVNLSSMI